MGVMLLCLLVDISNMKLNAEQYVNDDKVQTSLFPVLHLMKVQVF